MIARRAVCKAMAIVVVCIVAGAGGCGPKPQATPLPIDVSLLTGKPCEPPCWQGLTPGLSTEADVKQFLETSRLVDRASVFRGDVTNGSGAVVGAAVQWHSAAHVQEAYGWNCIEVQDGLVQWIEAYLDFEVTLEDLLGKYGPPDGLIGGLTGVHFSEFRVTLYYPRHGFIAKLILPVDDRYLRPDSRVVSIWYFRAAPLEEFVELGCEVGYLGGTADTWLESLRDWQGYGAIEAD
jgi:hypothetical protein